MWEGSCCGWEMTATDLTLLVVQDAQIVQRRRVLRACLQGALVAHLGLLHTPLDQMVCPCRQQATAGCTQGKRGSTCAKQDRCKPVKGVPRSAVPCGDGRSTTSLVLGGRLQSLPAPSGVCCPVLVTNSCCCAACENFQRVGADLERPALQPASGLPLLHEVRSGQQPSGRRQPLCLAAPTACAGPRRRPAPPRGACPGPARLQSW